MKSITRQIFALGIALMGCGSAYCRDTLAEVRALAHKHASAPGIVPTALSGAHFASFAPINLARKHGFVNAVNVAKDIAMSSEYTEFLRNLTRAERAAFFAGQAFVAYHLIRLTQALRERGDDYCLLLGAPAALLASMVAALPAAATLWRTLEFNS
jgi:hypothetical protein